MNTALRPSLFASAIEDDETHPPVEYLQLEHQHCRALLDRRGADGLLLCCGKTRVKNLRTGHYASSYCPTHDRLYQPGRYHREGHAYG